MRSVLRRTPAEGGAALLEAVLVAALGAILAFAANELSPRGLKLSENYFPGAPPGLASSTNNLAPARAAPTNATSPAELLSARLQQDGLQLADGKLAQQLFRDPRRNQDLVIFIDARDDPHYAAGHIPGAYQFDRFQPQDYLTNVVQACLSAEQIVFYCNGGDCEDSEHAAIILRDSLGLPKDKVFVYGGGMTEWRSNGLPVEVGVRNSGTLTNLNESAASGKPGSSK